MEVDLLRRLGGHEIPENDVPSVDMVLGWAAANLAAEAAPEGKDASSLIQPDLMLL